jgi:hypothetical protein
MWSRIRLFLALPLLLTFGTALAGTSLPQHNNAYWQVAFWDNANLIGEPVLTAAHKSIAWDWGTGSPDAAIPKNHFSARWRRAVIAGPGTYRFQVTSDDGVRLYLDNMLVIDEWHERRTTTSVIDVLLTSGQHLVVLEYFEQTGLAAVAFSWSRLELLEPRDAWRAEYFDNPVLRGTPAQLRDEEVIDHDWGLGSPSPAVSNDCFSVRWTRTLDFEPGLVRFIATSDDGVRLWVNGHLLIDEWHEHPPTSYSAMTYVNGDTELKMEYFENGGEAAARLLYGPLDDPTPHPVSTTFIVDDGSRAYVWTGVAALWPTNNVTLETPSFKAS